VRVWLGTDQDHYYVLSRFLVSRMLTVTKLPPLKAVKIALELKKALVDTERLNLTQVGLPSTATIALGPRTLERAESAWHRVVWPHILLLGHRDTQRSSAI